MSFALHQVAVRVIVYPIDPYELRAAVHAAIHLE